METMYLVTYVRHNAETKGTAYKTELATTSLSEAKKKYHALLADFIDNPTYDFVCVIINDSFGNRIMAEYEDSTVVPNEE